MLLDDLANVKLLQMHLKFFVLDRREVEQLGGRDHFRDFDNLNSQHELRYILLG